MGHLVAENRRMRKLSWLQDYLPNALKFLAESLYEIEYVNPYNGKKMSVMLRTDHDDEVIRLLEAVGHVT